MDLALAIPAQRPGAGSTAGVAPETSGSAGRRAAPAAASPQQPAAELRFICVCEVRYPSYLMTGHQPVDLVAACEATAWSPARAAVAQVYTYMQVSKMCFGFITCYLFTWPVYCPPKDRTKLYIAAPIPAGARHSPPDTRAGTAMGAMAWLSAMALRHAGDAVDGPPASADGTRSADDDNDDDDDDGDTDAHDTFAPSDSDHSPGPSRRANTPREPDGTKRARMVTRAMLPPSSGSGGTTAAASTLVLGKRLCTGSSGIVVRGTYGGQEAVIKLLGPSIRGLRDYDRELQGYQALAALQGDVVPELLGAGPLMAGVCFVAVRFVPGSPLCDLPPSSITQAVAAAAKSALQRVHSAQPGFLHGDVRLANIIVKAAPPGSDTSVPPQCVIIDFGRCRVDGQAREQKAERRELRHLLPVS